MTDKEKIRAEVERLNKKWWLNDSTEGKYRCETYKEIIEFIDSLPEEPVSEDLEEAAYEQIPENKGYSTIIDKVVDYNSEKRRYWLMGAQWQKQQMEKDVAEGTYDCNDTESWISFKGWIESTSKVGDKVKVIIIKEDEK